MTENRLSQYWAEQQPQAAQEQKTPRQLQLLSQQDLYRDAHQRAVFDYQLNQLFNPDHYRNETRDY